MCPFVHLHYHISREKFEPEPEVWVRVPVQVQIFLLKSDNKFRSTTLSNQIIKWKQSYNLSLCTFTLSYFKRKIRTGGPSSSPGSCSYFYLENWLIFSSKLILSTCHCGVLLAVVLTVLNTEFLEVKIYVPCHGCYGCKGSSMVSSQRLLEMLIVSNDSICMIHVLWVTLCTSFGLFGWYHVCLQGLANVVNYITAATIYSV